MFEVKLIGDVIKVLAPTSVDDFVDKAHYYGTTLLLLFFSLILGAKQIFGSPISCLTLASYNGDWSTYINNFCFVNGTFTVEADGDAMPWEIEKLTESQKVSVDYYQWVPYILLVQAALFYGPHLMWYLFQKTQTAISFEQVVRECVAGKDMTVVQREKKLNDVVQNLAKTHEFHRKKDRLKGFGYSGLVAYVTSKVLNIANLVVQLYFIHSFVGQFAWDKQVLSNVFGGLQQNVYFPRVSYCTFKQNVLANLNLQSVQCLLMMNIINEKMFIILYFWFAALLLASIANLGYLLILYFFNGQRSANRYLQTRSGKDVDARSFASGYLGPDGLLLLHFIEGNVGFNMASEVAYKLYCAIRGESSAAKKEKVKSAANGGRNKMTVVRGFLTSTPAEGEDQKMEKPIDVEPQPEDKQIDAEKWAGEREVRATVDDYETEDKQTPHSSNFDSGSIA